MLRQRPQMAEDAYKKKMRDKGFNDEGKFIPDSIPMAPPIGYKRTPPLYQTIREMVQHAQLQEDLKKAGVETLEESDDFDVDGDPFPASKYEIPDDLEPVSSVKKRATAKPSKPSSDRKGKGGEEGSRPTDEPDESPSPQSTDDIPPEAD